MNKAGFDEMVRIKRENYRNEIRKQDINQKMSIKRQKILDQTQQSFQSVELNFPKFLASFKFMEGYIDPKDVPNKNYFAIYQEILKTLIDEDYKGNILGIVCCLTLFRKLSMDSANMSVSSGELIRSGLVDYLEKYIDPEFNSFSDIQVESCWIISNMCAPEHMDLSFLWNTKIAEKLVSLLKSNQREVVYNAIWALSNICGDSLDYRNKFLGTDLIDSLITIINRMKNKMDPMYDHQALGEVIWLVSNLCRGKPYPKYDEVSKFLDVLPDCFNVLNLQGLENALWTLYYLTDHEQFKIKNFMRLNLTSMVVSMSKESESKLKIPALRILGNVSTSDDQDVTVLLDNNLLDVLSIHLKDQNKFLRKEIAWILSNLLSSGSSILQRVFDHEIFDAMRQRCLHDEVIVRKELLIAFSNSTQNASIQQILSLIEQDLIYIIIQGLDIQDPKTILSILEAFDNLLDANHECNKVRHSLNVEENRIFDELEKFRIDKILDDLQKFPANDVYQRALQIVERHFVNEEVLN